MDAATPLAPAATERWAKSLDELTALGLRAAATVVAVMETEQRTVAVAAAALPADTTPPTSLEAATIIDAGINGAGIALTQATPRITTLSQSYERIARAVRRTVVLGRRIEQGWPSPRATPDTSQALLLRQALRALRDTIRTHPTGDKEAAERLFADLSAHLDDPTVNHELEVVKEIIQALQKALSPPPTHKENPKVGWASAHQTTPKTQIPAHQEDSG